MSPNHIFVYGTLMKGLPLAQYMRHCKFVAEAEAAGTLYNLNFFPGFVPSEDGKVKGELYALPENKRGMILGLLDVVEGEGSMYNRKVLDVTTEAGEIPAYIYCLAHENPTVFKVVPNGDWRRRNEEKPEEDRAST